MTANIGIAELYAIRDAQTFEELRRRLFSVLSDCGSAVCSMDSVDDLIADHIDVTHPDIVRAIGFAREARARLEEQIDKDLYGPR